MSSDTPLDARNHRRIPIRAKSGYIVGFIVDDGIQIFDKRLRCWDTFDLTTLVKQHSQLQLVSKDEQSA